MFPPNLRWWNFRGLLFNHVGRKNQHGDPWFINALACHHFKRKRFLFSRPDLHPSLVTLSLSLLSKATYIRGEANAGQGQSFALTEHKCITSGLNYLGITRRVAPCHCASHNRFKQVENVFRRRAGGLLEGGRWDWRGLKSACVSLYKKYAFNIIWLQLRVASNNCFEIRTKIYFPFPKQ